MSPSESWTFLKLLCSDLLGPEPSAIFLGTLLAYPFHRMLREEFALVPALWLHGSKQQPTGLVGDLVHSLFHSDPAATFRLAFDDTGTGTITSRLAAYPHAPYYLDSFTDKAAGMNRYFKDSCDMGHCASGVYGTIGFNVTSIVPPILSGCVEPQDPSLSVRFLHFHLPADATLERDPDQWQHLHQIIPQLMLGKGIDSRIRNACRAIEGRYASSMPTLPFRRRIQLAIATGVFTTADLLLAGESAAAREIPDWMTTRHRFFDPNPAFF